MQKLIWFEVLYPHDICTAIPPTITRKTEATYVKDMISKKEKQGQR